MVAGLVLLVARVLIAAMFLSSGYGALTNIGATAEYFAGLGFPLATLVAIGTGIFEVVMGAVLIAGLRTRIAALVLAAFCIVATFIGHYQQGFGETAAAFTHWQAFLKDVAVAGGLLAFVVHGAGIISLDAALERFGTKTPDTTPDTAPAATPDPAGPA